jgi:phosphate:Na+ symporter
MQMIISLLGGLGLFLYGMKMLGDGLEKAAGNRLKRLIEVLTTNRFMGVLIGAAVSAIIQSSSATTVMVVGFVNTGLMTLMQATGVIMGANIGTTVTAQLIAFKLTDVAPIAIAIGVGFIFFAPKKSLKHLGEIMAGFGILFMGMDIMSESMSPLRSNEQFISFLLNFKNPLYGITAGAIFTGIIQSSSASIGILQAMAFQGIVGLDVALPILFGMNIGTCITTLLASIGTSVTAKRAAIVHLSFNVIGTAVFLLIIQFIPFAELIQSLSPGNVARQIANAHTVFNIINTILLFPFAKQLVNIASRIIPSKPEHISEKRFEYLDQRILETPAVAVLQIMKEVGRMADFAIRNVELSMSIFFDFDEGKQKRIYENEELINFLNHGITEYLVKLSNISLNEEQAGEISGLFHTVNDLERVGDHAENLTELAQYKEENRLEFSNMAISELEELYNKVLGILKDSIEALKNDDMVMAASIEQREEEVDDMVKRFREAHIDRLNKGQCQPSSAVIYLDMLNNLERISDHAVNIAFSVLERNRRYNKLTVINQEV